MSFVKHIGLRVGCVVIMIVAMCIYGLAIIMIANGVTIISAANTISTMTDPDTMNSIATSEIITKLTGIIEVDIERIVGAP